MYLHAYDVSRERQSRARGATLTGLAIILLFAGGCSDDIEDNGPGASSSGSASGGGGEGGGGAEGGGGSSSTDGGEHVGILRGSLVDPATAHATHDAGAQAAESVAGPLGDVAHIVGLGASVLGTAPTEWVAIDRWVKPDGMDAFYGDPNVENGLSALVGRATVSQYRRLTDWYGWGDYDAAAGVPRWYTLVTARLRDLSTAKEKSDAGAKAVEATAKSLGDVAHLVFAGREDEQDFLAIDIWTSPAQIAAFYSDPKFAELAAEVFDGEPSLAVMHATDWYQWGSVGEPTLDGVWKIASLTCSSKPVQLGDFSLEVRGPHGTFVQVFDPNCVATYDEDYAYAGANEFEITANSIACDPSTSCEAILGASCLPTPPPTSFEWELSADTLTFNRTAEGPGDLPCQPGDAIEFVMDRQSL